MENRRAHPRYETAVAAELLIGDEAIPCAAKNLSLGGVGLSLRRALAEGAVVIVNIFLTEDGIEDASTPSLNLRASVVWSAEVDAGHCEAGLRFESLHPQQSQLLQHFFSRLG